MRKLHTAKRGGKKGEEDGGKREKGRGRREEEEKIKVEGGRKEKG